MKTKYSSQKIFFVVLSCILFLSGFVGSLSAQVTPEAASQTPSKKYYSKRLHKVCHSHVQRQAAKVAIMAAVARRDNTYVSNADYAAFLNAVAVEDNHGLYDLHMSCNGLVRTGEPGAYVYSVDQGEEDQAVTYVSWFCAARYCNWLENNQATALMNPDVTESGAYTLEEDRCTAVTETASHLLPETSDEVSFDQFPEISSWGTPNFSNEEIAFLFSETSGEVTSQTIDWSLRSGSIGIRFKTTAASSLESGNAPRTYWDDVKIGGEVLFAIVVAGVVGGWVGDDYTDREGHQGTLENPEDENDPYRDPNNNGAESVPVHRQNELGASGPEDRNVTRRADIEGELAQLRQQKEADEQELKRLQESYNADRRLELVHAGGDQIDIEVTALKNQIEELKRKIQDHDANIARLEEERRALPTSSSISINHSENLEARKARINEAHEGFKKREPLETHWGEHTKLRDEIAKEMPQNIEVLSELKTLAMLEDRVAGKEGGFRSSGVTQSDLADAALQRQLKLAKQAVEGIEGCYRDLKTKSTRLVALEERLKDAHLNENERDEITVEIHSFTKELETIEGAFQQAVKSRDEALTEARRLAAKDAKRREDERTSLSETEQQKSKRLAEITGRWNKTPTYRFTHFFEKRKIAKELKTLEAKSKGVEADGERISLVKAGTERMSLEALSVLNPAEKEFLDALELRRIVEENKRTMEWLLALMKADKDGTELPYAMALFDYLSEKGKAAEARVNRGIELLDQVERDAESLFDSRSLESYHRRRAKIEADYVVTAEQVLLLEEELVEAKAMREILVQAKTGATHFDPNASHSREELAAARQKLDESITSADNTRTKAAAAPAVHHYSAEKNKNELRRLYAVYATCEKDAEATMIESSDLLLELKKYAKQEKALLSNSSSSSSARPPLQASFEEVHRVMGALEELIEGIAKRKGGFFEMLERIALSDADHRAIAREIKTLNNDLVYIDQSLADVVRGRGEAVTRARGDATSLKPKETTLLSSHADKEIRKTQQAALKAAGERYEQACGFMGKIVAHFSNVSERLRKIEKNIMEDDDKRSQAPAGASERGAKSETASDPSSERDAAFVKRTKAFEYLKRTEEDICDFIDEFKRHELFPIKRLENRLKKILKQGSEQGSVPLFR